MTVPSGAFLAAKQQGEVEIRRGPTRPSVFTHTHTPPRGVATSSRPQARLLAHLLTPKRLSRGWKPLAPASCAPPCLARARSKHPAVRYRDPKGADIPLRAQLRFLPGAATQALLGQPALVGGHIAKHGNRATASRKPPAWLRKCCPSVVFRSLPFPAAFRRIPE